ncbi:MAG TPA: hypothetical protein VK190_03010 [Pseudoneobacillus sp.]|nr:hypothetical protein [Pseudoneobacillus sp.]
MFNDFNAQVYGDLSYLFRESDLVERAVVNYSTLNNGNLASIENEINVLKARIKALKLVLFENGNVTAVTEQFNNMSSLDTNLSLYEDRDGSFIHPVEYRDSTEASEITLKHIDAAYEISPDKTHDVFDVDILDISIDKVIGGSYEGNLSSMSVYASDIIQMPYTFDDKSTIDQGALLFINATLQIPAYVNTIKIEGNTIKNMVVSRILYYDDNRYFSVPNTIMVEKEINKTLTLNIAPTRIKRMTIVLQQLNYEAVE